MLSFIYRLLTRARACTSTPDEVTLDMLATFEEARADARSRGRWSYFLFAIRELAGLLGSPGRIIPRTRWTMIVGCALAGLALGAVASFLLPASYTSEAVLQLAPPGIPAGLLANLDALDRDTSGFEGRGLDLLRQEVTSRQSLMKIIVDFDLYQHARARTLFIEVIEEMRKHIRIERTGEFSIRVAFTYGDYPPGTVDNHKAQRVTVELVTQLIDAARRNQVYRLFQAEQYFKDRTDETARTWDRLNGQSRGLTAEDPRFDRLTLDRELARKEYESMRQKMAEAQAAKKLSNRRVGRDLQVLDGASLPEGPQTPVVEMIVTALYGLGCGLVVALIASLWLALRRTSGVLLTPETAPGH